MSHVHNSLHRCTQLLQGYKRALGMDVSEDGVERIGETLTAVLDLWSQPEFALPRGEYLGHGNLVVSGVAATRTIVGVRNISTQDDSWVVVVEPGSSCTSSGGTAVASTTLTDIADNKGLIGRDGRMGHAPPMVRIRAENIAIPAGVTNGIVLFGHNPVTVIRLEQPIVLRDGQSFYFLSDTDALTLTASFYTRSRKSFPGEHRLP